MGISGRFSFKALGHSYKKESRGFQFLSAFLKKVDILLSLVNLPGGNYDRMLLVAKMHKLWDRPEEIVDKMSELGWYSPYTQKTTATMSVMNYIEIVRSIKRALEGDGLLEVKPGAS